MAKEGKKGKKLEYDPVLFDQDVEAYRVYWESIQDEFPKKFAKAYWGTKFSDYSHFHDYYILRFSMMGNYNTYKHETDTIEMVIYSDTGLYEITFSKIHKVYCSFEVTANGICENWLTDILQSWIGISKEGNYIFEFQTGWSPGRVRIDFEKVRVVEHTLRSYFHKQKSEN